MRIPGLLMLLLLPAMLPAAAVEGIAVDHEGDPYPHVRLELHRLTWDAAHPHAQAQVIDVAQSDGEGRFRFDGLAEDGVYRIISPATIDHATGWHLPVTPGEGPVEVGITATYRLALGIIIEQDGTPIEGAKIWRRHEQMVPGRGRVMTVMASAESDADGVFALGPVIEPRVVPIEVELPDGTVFRASVNAQSIDEHDAEASVVIAPERETGIIHVVDANGEPVGNVSVRLQQISPQGGTGLITEFISSASGEVVHGGLASGEHRVRLTDGIHTVDGLTFSVSESDTTPEIVLTFLGPGSVSGRLMTADGGPAPEIPVHVTAPQGSGTHTAQVLTDGEGRFVVEGLPLTDITLALQPGPRHGFEGDTRTTVMLTEDESHADLTELPRVVPVSSYAITGHVRTSGGSGIEGVSVRLVPADPMRLQRLAHVGVGGLVERTMDQPTVQTDGSGAFTFETEVRPEAMAAIWAEDGQGRAGVFDLQPTRRHRWTTEAFQHESITVPFAETVAVTGQVNGQTLNPAERWEIQFFLNQAQTEWWQEHLEDEGQVGQEFDELVGNYFLFSTQADEEGRFEVTLPRGTPWVAKLASQRLSWTNSVAFEVPLAEAPEPITLGEPAESQESGTD